MSDTPFLKLLWYIVIFMIVFTLLKFLPSNSIDDKDCMLIALIIVIIVSLCSTLVDNNCSRRPRWWDQYEMMEDIPGQTAGADPRPVPEIGHFPPVDAILPINHEAERNIEKPTSEIKLMPDGSYDIPVKETKVWGDKIEPSVKYTDYNNFPMYNVGSFEKGYHILPPSQWYPQPPHPPVCVTTQKCPVCPVYSNTDTVNLMEWDEARKITAPGEINVDNSERRLPVS